MKKLGFGLMRLPMDGNEIDLRQTAEMIDLFLEKGFRYFDTAYGYLGGASEKCVKPLLVDRYPRERFELATKLPAWAGVQTKEEAEKMFYTSLERTGAGYFDRYLCHNLGEGRTALFDRFDLWNFLGKRKEEGLIKKIGFSFHDKAAVLEEILKAHPEVDFVQLQINYADWENPGVESRACYETAVRYGKPVVVMEPVKGGTLMMLPEAAAERLRQADPAQSFASWAIRFAASLPEVEVVLSGMSNLEQMRDNLSFMESFTPMDAQELAVIQKVQAELSRIPTIPCTACGYCMDGCPRQIPIRDTFQAMNRYQVFKDLKAARQNYGYAIDGCGKASDCIECGQCEGICPQHIGIIEELKKAVAVLE